MIIFHPKTHLVNVPPLASLNYDSFSDSLVLVMILIVLKIMVSFCRVLHFDFIFFFFSDHFVLQISSVSQSCLSLCDPMEYSMPGLLVHPQILGLAQTHVHWVGDVIQPPTLLLFYSFIFDFWETTWGKLSLLHNVKGIYYQYEFCILGLPLWSSG